MERAELTTPWQAVMDAGGTPELVAPEGGQVQAFNHLDRAEAFTVHRAARHRPHRVRRGREQACEEVAVVEPNQPAGKPPGVGSESGPAAGDPRQETEAQRNDRNLSELIQELRVVSLGVQVLFGFLLSLPFTVRFGRLDTLQRDLYLAALVLSAVATTLLLGPVAYHRLVFRRAMKEATVRYASLMATLGLAVVGGAVLVAVLLVTDVVAGPLPAALITALVACLLGAVWYAMPFARRSEKRGTDTS